GGFCLLIARPVLERIGTALDEWSDLGLFDSDILSAKARQGGFTPVCCRDLFIHHFGTRTFAHCAPASPELCRGSGERVRGAGRAPALCARGGEGGRAGIRAISAGGCRTGPNSAPRRRSTAAPA